MSTEEQKLSEEELRRKNAIISSRVFLLMQWPAYTVLGLMGIVLPLITPVDQAAFLGSMLLITALVQSMILVRYGINPGFAWRAVVTAITFLASYITLMNPFDLNIPLTMTIGVYMMATGFYVVIEGRYSFSSRHIESVVYCGYFGMALGLSIFSGFPDTVYWTPATALGLYLIALGFTARRFLLKKLPEDAYIGSEDIYDNWGNHAPHPPGRE
tara:strand:+ start:27800 stop:28441 length:642 start_codon:yes stop_codon:yes gene_type:complete